MKSQLISFVVGLVFALGLGVSGMTQPQKVVAFLDIFGNWDPALAFVMVGAILFHAIAYLVIKRRKSPILSDQFHIPNRKDLTPSLFAGAILFGAGWGLAGFCPGPGIVSLLSGNLDSFIFVCAMLAGMTFFHFTKNYLGPLNNK